MDSKHKTKAIILIGVGIILEILALILLLEVGTEFLFWSSFLFVLLGWFCFLIGCIYFTEGKGHNWVWGLLLGLFFNLIGVLLIFLLPEKEVEKIPPFFPEERKRKFILILVSIVLLVILVFVGKQAMELRGIGQQFEEAAKAREELKKWAEDEEIISKMRKITEELYDLQVENGYELGIYTGLSCDHPRIKSFCDEIKELIGTKPIIHSTGDKYCGYIKLPSGKYSCIDNSLLLFTAETESDPFGSGRCDGITFVCYEKKEEKAHVGINIISPAGGELLKEGWTQSIVWEQWDLTGEKVKICLLGSDSSYQSLSAKGEYQGECSDLGSYQIGKEIYAESGKYDWKIPINLSNKFWGTLAFYRVKIMPMKTITELGVSVRYGFSDYFEISR